MSHHVISVHLWFAVGLFLLIGFGPSSPSARYEAFYGYGKFDVVPAVLVIAAPFAVAFWNLRRWPVATRLKAGPTIFYAGANAWLLFGLALLVGIGQHASSSQYVSIFGYGRLYPVTAYLGVGVVFAVAAWYFRHWRRANQPEPAVVRPVRPAVNRAPSLAFAGVIGVTLLVLGLAVTRSGLQPDTHVPVGFDHGQPAAVDRPWMNKSAPRVEVAPARVMFVVPAVVFAVFLATAFFVIRRLQKLQAEPELEPVAADERPPTAPPPPPPAAPRACPQCHAAVAADAPQGLCPRCLMAGAFGSILNPSRTGPFAGPFEPPTPEEVQEHFPNLEVLGFIGQGGMGAVYQARQPNLDRTVALKLIRPREDNPTFRERFVREARAMAKLSHPNIVHVHESGEAGGSLFLVMEFVDGVTLREAIRAKAIPPAEAMKIVGQLCDTLEYAHAQGVVHRDIKPENILLDRAGRVKVVDFGLAKLANDTAVSLTHTRQAMGTPHYMAPEQWEKPTEVDHRADIYALGVVIYELLTGELPLGRFDPPSVKARLDARIDEIVLRLLAKEPDRRYQTASDVRTALFNMGPVAAYRAPTRRRDFYEYRSEAEFWGWPLVHVVGGIDPRTGTKRIAKGWVAVGDVMAVGVLALSGVFSVGLFAVAGVLGLGGLALAGALAVGGGAVGGNAAGFFALGGVALGWLAVGGVAVGKFALGGAAVGEHTNKRGANPQFWDNVREELNELFGG